MEAIGEKLRTAREEQGRSIEELARETNIAKRYIIALEEENFDTFPGEPYLIGFLRTYSETLGLVPDEIVALYKSFKIQEQPLPMDELIQTPNRKKWWLVLVVIAVLGGIGAGVYFFVPGLRDVSIQRAERPEKAETDTVAESDGTVYEMKDEIIERRFLEGDTIQVLVGNNEYPLKLVTIGKQLTVSTGSGDVELSVGEESTIDLNGDAKDDIKIYVRDIDTAAEAPAAVVRFDKFTQASIAAAGGENPEDDSSIFLEEAPAGDEPEAAETGGETETVPVVGSTNFASREQRVITILEQDEPRPFTVDLIFRGYCMLRYLNDKNVREERYFHKGETFRLENSQSLRLWISNAGACKGRIAGQEIEFGRSGEVATKLIQWRRDDQADAWKLTLEPVY